MFRCAEHDDFVKVGVSRQAVAADTAKPGIGGKWVRPSSVVGVPPTPGAGPVVVAEVDAKVDGGLESEEDRDPARHGLCVGGGVAQAQVATAAPVGGKAEGCLAVAKVGERQSMRWLD